MDHSHFIGQMRAGVLMTCVILSGGAPVPVSVDGNAHLPCTDLQTPTRIQPPVPIASPDMDTLAKKMAQEISKKKIGILVVVGGGGPENKVTDLGAKLRDAFNDSLARQSQKTQVLEGKAVRDMLRKNRISEGMLYTDVIGPWIVRHAPADAYVILRLFALTGAHASVVAELFTRNKWGFESIHREAGILALADQQLASAEVDFQPEMNNPGALPVSTYTRSLKCLVCPNPSYSEEGRRLKISGTVVLSLVVRPDGATDDVMVVHPLGHGLDANAIDSVLEWKFQAGKDLQGQTAAMQVQVEVSFTLR
jgi:TonB family protein